MHEELKQWRNRNEWRSFHIWRKIGKKTLENPSSCLRNISQQYYPACFQFPHMITCLILLFAGPPCQVPRLTWMWVTGRCLKSNQNLVCFCAVNHSNYGHTNIEISRNFFFSFQHFGAWLPLMVGLVRLCQTWGENLRPDEVVFGAIWAALVFAGDFRSRLFSWTRFAEMRGGGGANLRKEERA